MAKDGQYLARLQRLKYIGEYHSHRVKAKDVKQSSSLCDGLAKRIFTEYEKEVHLSDELNASKYQQNAIRSVENTLKLMARICQTQHRKRDAIDKMALLYLTENTLCFSQSMQAPRAIALTKPGEPLTALVGYQVTYNLALKTQMLNLTNLILHHNAPKKSMLKDSNVRFTMHAISRLIERFQPANVYYAINVIDCLLSQTIESSEQNMIKLQKTPANQPLCIHIEGLGLLVVAKSKDSLMHVHEDPECYITVVTVIDEKHVSETKARFAHTHFLPIQFHNEAEQLTYEDNLTGLTQICFAKEIEIGSYRINACHRHKLRA